MVVTGTAAVAASTGVRQLVLCCDGTNNTLTAGIADTNVLQFHKHLVENPAPQGIERILFYDPGVGSPDVVPPTDPVDWFKRSVDRTSGLASGRGIYDNVQEAYLFLMRHWRGDQDQIYCFGFSRGAFTARCVVGMVHLFGIIEAQHEAMVPTLIRIYFSLPSGQGRWWQKATGAFQRGIAKQGVGGRPVPVKEGRDRLAEQVRELFATVEGRAAWVHWVGVWDTVESVGLPGPLSRSNPSTATFIDKRVRHVRHALAFDEHRWTFIPRLYEVPDDVAGKGRTLQQRWFPGVHCDVGGGYATDEQGLSSVAFRWMIDEAAVELRLPPLPVGTATAHRTILHDALYETPWWALGGMCLRDMRPFTRVQPSTQQGAQKAPNKRVPMCVRPYSAPSPLPSVWDTRRAFWPVALAVVLALFFYCIEGERLKAGGRGNIPDVQFIEAWARAWQFSIAQVQTLIPSTRPDFPWVNLEGGLLSRLPWNRDLYAHAAWAMLWHLAFIGAYGYLLARISSRTFTWMVGRSESGQKKPRWIFLGMAPLLAVGGDAMSSLTVLLGFAVHGIGVDWLASIFLSLSGVACLVGLVGLVACVPFVILRFAMVVVGRSRLGAVK